MGRLVNGKWCEEDNRVEPGGKLKTEVSEIRSWVQAQEPGKAATKGVFPAEIGRYHLFVSLACPFAHRTLIMHKLKGLEQVVSVSGTLTTKLNDGWQLSATTSGGINADGLSLSELYRQSHPHYSGRSTVPVLWDKHSRQIVSNDSRDIMRMLNSDFNQLGATEGDYYPLALHRDIDALSKEIQENVNVGVYRAGFAGNQQSYEEAVHALFSCFDRLEARLTSNRYLFGDTITESDWCLFPSLIRFDSIYYLHFKCNLRRLVDYPHLWRYTRDLYREPGVADTVNLEHIKHHYFSSHRHLNPSGIVPLGPELSLHLPGYTQRLD